MSQQDINEEILHILTCLIHADDKYERECVDLNANAFLIKLKAMILVTRDEIRTKTIICAEEEK